MTMSEANELIHQTVRLRVMAALTALPPREEGLDFTRLKKLTAATDGNLGAHIETLVRAGYVEVQKRFEARRPKTIVKATPVGRKEFAAHVAFLRGVIGE
jgi:DNA-binding MarR family transcriptional regulator